jgi:uncharacterized membrane protein
MKVIGIQVENRDRGDFVIDALQTALAQKRVTLDDIALVTKDDDGTVRIHQTKDITTKKGAVRGTLVGAVIGLAAPPLLGAAVVGAGVGALWGKLRDRGIDDDTMKKLVEPLHQGQAIVFALGDDASIDAISARVAELSIGGVQSFTFDPDDENELRAAAQDIRLPDSLLVRAPIS